MRSAFLWVVLVWAFAAIRLFYGQGTGEHDTFMMAAAIVRGAQTGQIINVFCYGEQLQFLFYYGSALFTRVFVPTAGEVLLVMNIFGAASALATPLLMLHLFPRLLGDRAQASVAVVLLVTSPLYLFTATYGHPFMFAVPLLLLAWISLVAALDESDPSRKRILLVAGLLLQSVALMVRFEQILLLSSLLLGLLTVRERTRVRRLLPVAVILAASCFAFIAVRALALGAQAPSAESTAPSSSGTVVVLLRTLNPELVKWGIAHVTVGVGPVLLLLAIAAFALCIQFRRYEQGVVLLTGVAPSLLIYLGNPSPPRHFYVLTVGLACFVAGCLPSGATRWVRRAAVFVLLINLAAPWSLIPVDGRHLPDRANVTYNVIQRIDRNRAQIAVSEPFYRAILHEAERRPVVVLGSWVHFAEIAALVVNEPRSQLLRAKLPGGVPALQLRSGRAVMYFIETYDPRYAAAAARTLKSKTGLPFLSLVDGAGDVNDLHLSIPPAVLWWNA